MNLVEDNLKLNSLEMAQNKTRLESFPISMNICTTKKCNMSPPCVMCQKAVRPDPPQDIGWEIIEKLKQILPTTAVLILHGVGEPLIYDKLFDLIGLASRETKNVFTTNGRLLQKYSQLVVDNVFAISVSIDAATDVTYKAIRHRELNQIKEGIKRLVSLKRRQNQKTPYIDINMCLMRRNIGDAPYFVKMGKDLGVDAVHFYHMNEGVEYDWQAEWFDYKKQSCLTDPIEHDYWIKQAMVLSKELNVAVIFDGRMYFNSDERDKTGDMPNPMPAPTIPNSLFCDLPWRQLQINTNGKVNNCCYQLDEAGDLNTQFIDDIWNGKALLEIREGIVSGKLSRYCAKAICPPNGRI